MSEKNNLRFKAKFYQYTGIYLAAKEEQAYLELPTTKLKIFKMHGSDESEELSLDNAKSIIIGSWQVNHGFCRPISFLRYDYPNIFGKIAAWIHILFKVLRNDVRSLCGR